MNGIEGWRRDRFRIELEGASGSQEVVGWVREAGIFGVREGWSSPALTLLSAGLGVLHDRDFPARGLDLIEYLQPSRRCELADILQQEIPWLSEVDGPVGWKAGRQHYENILRLARQHCRDWLASRPRRLTIPVVDLSRVGHSPIDVLVPCPRCCGSGFWCADCEDNEEVSGFLTLREGESVLECMPVEVSTGPAIRRCVPRLCLTPQRLGIACGAQ